MRVAEVLALILYKVMRGNLFKCGNEVFVEGKSIGQFQSLEIKEDRDELVNTCVMLIPIYAIGTKPGMAPNERIRAALEGINIKPGARIEVYGWYYDNPAFEQFFEKILLFSGFIRQVIGGFPSKFICEDHSFILRFGSINREWLSRTKLKDMIDYLCPISNEAFRTYRDEQGFSNPDDFTKLSFDSSNSADVEFALQTFKLISPYDALMKLLKMFVLYGHVNELGKVYFGIGVIENTKRTVELSTDKNVIDRDIVPTNGLFVNYKVIVSALLADGTRYTYEYGDSEGEPERMYVPHRTAELVEETAKSAMLRLRGNRNRGTINTILYPAMRLFDFIKYTDTLFPVLVF